MIYFIFQKIQIFLSILLIKIKNPKPVHYIGSAETLPPPLSPCEEEALI